MLVCLANSTESFHEWSVLGSDQRPGCRVTCSHRVALLADLTVDRLLHQMANIFHYHTHNSAMKIKINVNLRRKIAVVDANSLVRLESSNLVPMRLARLGVRLYSFLLATR